ncbi:hypothetical protein KIN20_013265 [Parelaphostrongylus tenuis]|uniref:Uncharacterized protein n=1 Tax=Parelaphostrongylus tenuis TaxID=148309 RepID=A0AAD5QMH2_PARTN|nr:hypothetical protein KIN20_013265 [Parelaphostrongylus tenuis]
MGLTLYVDGSVDTRSSIDALKKAGRRNRCEKSPICSVPTTKRQIIQRLCFGGTDELHATQREFNNAA